MKRSFMTRKYNEENPEAQPPRSVPYTHTLRAGPILTPATAHRRRRRDFACCNRIVQDSSNFYGRLGEARPLSSRLTPEAAGLSEPALSRLARQQARQQQADSRGRRERRPNAQRWTCRWADALQSGPRTEDARFRAEMLLSANERGTQQFLPIQDMMRNVSLRSGEADRRDAICGPCWDCRRPTGPQRHHPIVRLWIELTQDHRADLPHPMISPGGHAQSFPMDSRSPQVMKHHERLTGTGRYRAAFAPAARDSRKRPARPSAPSAAPLAGARSDCAGTPG